MPTPDLQSEKIADEAEPIRPSYTTPPLGTAPTALHTGMRLPRYYAMHIAGAFFPLMAGLLLYGWRATGLVAILLLCCWGAAAIWRRIGWRGEQIYYSHILYLGLLLALALPAQLFSFGLPWLKTNEEVIFLIPAAALLMVIFCWFFGGVGSSRVHPVALTILILTILFYEILTPRTVLQPDSLFFGDSLDATPPIGSVWGDPWTRLPPNPDHAAVLSSPAALPLTSYTRGLDRPTISSMTLGDLMRDRLPPLEDIIVAGQPAPIGLASAIAILIGGLILLYNSVIDYRIPLFVIIGAYLAFVFLPIPISLESHAAHYRWLVMREPGVGWEMGITLANYELLAGPLLLIAFFFATWPACRPMYRRGRVIYALILGILAGALQLYLDVGYGAYVALVLASLLTPLLDAWMRPRPLV